MPPNLRSTILPPELTDFVLHNLVGFDLAQYACAAKAISTMTLKAKVMFASGLTLTSKAARLSDALLRNAHGDAHVTRLRVDGCIEKLHDSFDDEDRQHACFGLMRVKFEGPPLNAILLNRVDAALRWLCASQRAIFNESEGCFIDSLYVRLMDAFRIEDEHSARCAAQICCRLASDRIFTSGADLVECAVGPLLKLTDKDGLYEALQEEGPPGDAAGAWLHNVRMVDSSGDSVYLCMMDWELSGASLYEIVVCALRTYVVDYIDGDAEFP